MVTVGNVDKLRGYAQPVARFADTAFQDSVHLQLASNLADVLVLSLKGERRCPSRHSKRFDFRQRVDDLLGNPITEEFVLRIVAHVDKGKNSDAFLGYFGNSSR